MKSAKNYKMEWVDNLESKAEEEIATHNPRERYRYNRLLTKKVFISKRTSCQTNKDNS